MFIYLLVRSTSRQVPIFCRMTTLILILAAQLVRAAQSTATLNNDIDNELDFYAVDVKAGSFVVRPPKQVQGNDSITWSAYGAFDVIGYDVYYQSDAWDNETCVRFSYLWDLVEAECNAVFCACPDKQKRANPKKVTKIAAMNGFGCGTVTIGYDCSGFLGDPTYTLSYACEN